MEATEATEAMEATEAVEATEAIEATEATEASEAIEATEAEEAMGINLEEEVKLPVESPKEIEAIPVCRCLRDDVSSEKIEIPFRKQQIFSTVYRTEKYLRDRRIPELMRFLLTKVIAKASDKPVAYLEKLLDDCMLFRAGLGHAPVLYKQRHLEAIVKSFDPGDRGWLSAGQVRRVFNTLGFPHENILEERVPTEVVLHELKRVQEKELFHLLVSGTKYEDLSLASSTASTPN